MAMNTIFVITRSMYKSAETEFRRENVELGTLSLGLCFGLSSRVRRHGPRGYVKGGKGGKRMLVFSPGAAFNHWITVFFSGLKYKKQEIFME